MPQYPIRHVAQQPSEFQLQAEALIETPQQTIALFEQNAGRVGVQPRANEWGSSAPVAATLMVLLLVALFSFSRTQELFYSFFENLFSEKRKRSFSDARSFATTRSRIFLLYASFLLEGLLAAILLNHYILPATSILMLWGISALAMWGVYLLFSGIYHLLGYVFLPKQERSLLIQDLTNIHIVRGILAFVLLILVIYAGIAFNKILISAFFIFILSRLLFIYRCLNNFFHGIYQIIYVVLYLCTLEIAPLWILYKGLFLCSFVELKLL